MGSNPTVINSFFAPARFVARLGSLFALAGFACVALCDAALCRPVRRGAFLLFVSRSGHGEEPDAGEELDGGWTVM